MLLLNADLDLRRFAANDRILLMVVNVDFVGWRAAVLLDSHPVQMFDVLLSLEVARVPQPPLCLFLYL